MHKLMGQPGKFAPHPGWPEHKSDPSKETRFDMDTIGENSHRANRNDICRRPRTAGAADPASSRNLLAVKEAALVLGLAVSTLNKHRVYGTGPRFVKLGRSVRYRPADLDAWIDANRRASTSEESGCG